MQTFVVPVRREGEVTMPVEVRRHLGATARNAVEFVIRDDGVIEVRAPALSLEDVLGSLPPLAGMSEDFDAEIERAIEEHLASRYGPHPQ